MFDRANAGELPQDEARAMARLAHKAGAVSRLAHEARAMARLAHKARAMARLAHKARAMARLVAQVVAWCGARAWVSVMGPARAGSRAILTCAECGSDRELNLNLSRCLTC